MVGEYDLGSAAAGAGIERHDTPVSQLASSALRGLTSTLRHLMTVWRIKLNSMRAEADGGPPDWDEAKAYCRNAGLVGVGWGLPGLEHGAPLETVLAACRDRVDGNGGAQVIARLANQVETGDLMWTRDKLGRYWLGQITGPWRYDTTAESVRFDLYNVRPCEWQQEHYQDYDVPGAVVNSFTGVSQTLRRLGDHPAAQRVSEMLWRQDPAVAPHRADEVMTDLLDPTDVEDVVLLWLQAQGWLLLPSSRRRDTPVYEAVLLNANKERAVVSVKSGHSNELPIPELKKAAGEATAYAYSTHAKYTELPSEHDVIEIKQDELIAFMAKRPELLPPRIARWLAT